MEFPVPIEGVEANRVTVESVGLFSDVKLLVNGLSAKKSEKRGEYIIPRDDGSEMIARLKRKFLDPAPIVIVDGEEIRLVEPLKWYQWVWAGLPILLILTGGALGGFIGLVATGMNMRIFRSDTTGAGQYLQVAFVSIGAAVGYVILALIVSNLIG